MSVQSVRDRFLARTEQVRVLVPFEPEPVAELKAATEERDRLVAEYEQVKAEYEAEGARRKLTDTPPAEPDLSEVERWVADAERKVNENAIMVVLQWRPKRYAEILRTAAKEDHTSFQIAVAVAEAFYLRSEALEGDEWVDALLSWDDLADRLSEGELFAVGSQAQALANASDATPFVKRSRNSKPH